MQKPLILTVLFALFFAACTVQTGDKNQIFLFNGKMFNTLEGEIQGFTDSLATHKYEQYFVDQGKMQIPLFKSIKTNEYDLFVGLPIKTSIQQLAQFKKAQTNDSLLVIFESDHQYYYKKWKEGNSYLTEYASQYGGNTIFFLAAQTQSEQISNELFSKFALSKRISDFNE